MIKLTEEIFKNDPNYLARRTRERAIDIERITLFAKMAIPHSRLGAREDVIRLATELILVCDDDVVEGAYYECGPDDAILWFQYRGSSPFPTEVQIRLIDGVANIVFVPCQTFAGAPALIRFTSVNDFWSFWDQALRSGKMCDFGFARSCLFHTQFNSLVGSGIIRPLLENRKLGCFLL